MFLTKLYEILPFSKRQNWPKSNKNSLCCMFDANNISERSCVHFIIMMPAQASSKITFTPARHQLHSKTEISQVFEK